MKNVMALLHGLWITLRYGFSKPETIQYPDEQPVISPRFRGMIAFRPGPDGRQRCTGCGICQKECPEGVITVTRMKVEESDPESGETKSVPRPDVYTIDHSKCVFCGICTEACPFDAIGFLPEFELAAYEKRDLVRQIDDVRAASKTGGWHRPWMGEEGGTS